MDQLQSAKGIKPGVHLACKLIQILTLPERMIERLIRFDLLQASQ